MISPERFLAILEEKELLSPRTVASLREQIAQSAEPVTAAVLAKRLIKHGRLTVSQAKLIWRPTMNGAADVGRNEVETKGRRRFVVRADRRRTDRQRRQGRQKGREVARTTGFRRESHAGPKGRATAIARRRDDLFARRLVVGRRDAVGRLSVRSRIARRRLVGRRDVGGRDGRRRVGRRGLASPGSPLASGSRIARVSGVSSPENPRPARRPKKRNGADR